MSSPRCVVDTNVLISAGLFRDRGPRRLVEWVIRYGTLLASEETVKEFRSRFVGRDKFDRYLPKESREEFVVEVIEDSEVVAVTTRLALCRDPDDDRFAELALDGAADVVVTGNTRDFPADIRGIPVVTPAAFVERYVGR
ncbi:putative toxin-antitoxin system toxin component, PIN family [Rubrivirga sp.]|uniref:putative toxin-antitoxin system toxin component, PIN family n=1 Tax=Rubrivirga sp. TaxID=1885344 RepID=UPI003B52EF9A